MGFFGDFLSGALKTIGSVATGGIAAPLIGGISSLIGGLGSSGMSANQAEINRKFQAGEAQKNRDFNKAEAHVARQFQERMWNLNNSYNTPKASMQRLVEAGINPAMYYSSGTGIQNATLSSGSPQASVSSVPSGAMPDTSGIQHAGDAFNISRLNAAQASNLEQDANLKRIDSLTRDIKNKTDIRVGDSIIEYNFSGANLSDEEARKCGVEIDRQERELDRLDVEIDNAMKQGKILDTQVIFSEETLQTSIEQFKDAAKITKEQARNIVFSITADILQKQMSAWLSYNQASLTPYQRLVLQAQERELRKLGDKYEADANYTGWQTFFFRNTWQTEVEKTNVLNKVETDYAEAMKWIQIGGSILNEITGAAGTFFIGKGVLGGFKRMFMSKYGPKPFGPSSVGLPYN